MTDTDEYFAVKRKAVARYDIPAPLAREIGRFLVTWAHFEHYVQAVIWGALKISEEEGRITVREPRVTDRLDMLRDLGEFQNLEIDYVLLKEIRAKADPLAGKRHLLAHSIWQKFDDDWCVLVTRGTWQDVPIEITNYPNGRSKNLEPQAVPITYPEIRDWTEATIALIDELKKVGEQHRPVPLPEKRKKRFAPKDQTPDRSGSRRKSPRPTSAE
jgi:hypothetical protein